MSIALYAAVIFVFSAPLCLAGGDVRDLPPRAAAMGGAGCALGGAGFVLLNPAALTADGSGGSVYWTPQRFGLTELGSVNAGWQHTLSSWAAGAQLQRFGYAMYSEHRLDVSASVMVDSSIALGVRTSLHHVSIARYGNAMGTGVDIGIRIALGGGITLGATADNALQLPFTAAERLPQALRLGVGWQSGGLILALDAESRMRSALCLRFGGEYALHDAVRFRIGMAHDPQIVTVGCGLRLAGIDVEYAVQVHPDLGWTHTAGIGFQP